MRPDYIISNLIFYGFDMAYTLMQAENQYNKLCLSAPLDKEQAKKLKAEIGMTDTAIQTLRRCKTYWQAIQRDLDTLSPWMYGKIADGLYDWANAMTNELIAANALYIQQSNNDNDATIAILRNMIDIKPLDKDTAQFAKAWLSKAGDIRRTIFAKLDTKEDGKEG